MMRVKLRDALMKEIESMKYYVFKLKMEVLFVLYFCFRRVLNECELVAEKKWYCAWKFCC